MKMLPLVKDKTKIYMDEKHHYGITSPDNVVEKTLEKKYQNFTFNAEYLYNALSAMKNMNDGNLDFYIDIPKEPYPIVLDNGLQCYLIAPIVDRKNFEKAYGRD